MLPLLSTSQDRACGSPLTAFLMRSPLVGSRETPWHGTSSPAKKSKKPNRVSSVVSRRQFHVGWAFLRKTLC